MDLVNADILKDHPRISVDERIMGGTPCVKGTRIPLYVVLDNMEGGAGFDEIIKNYPSLTREDIQAVIRFSSCLASTFTHANPA